MTCSLINRTRYWSEGPAYHFHWREDGEVLSWDGQSQLPMDDFHGLSREVLRSATSCCQWLACGWDPANANNKTVRDRTSTTTTGYHFVSNPANGLALALRIVVTLFPF